MHKYLDNFNRLFSDDDSVVYNAILEKKDWMFEPLFIEGDLSISLDEEGKKHFYFLESLFDNTILFKKHESIKDDNFRYVKFTNKMSDEALFYVEYDFRKIDQKGYQGLVANFYPCLKEEELEFNSQDESVKETLKKFMIGKDNERVLILDKSALLNDRFYAPILKTIYIRKEAPSEVREVLESLANEKEIEIKEF